MSASANVRIEHANGIVRITLTGRAGGNRIGGAVDEAIFDALAGLNDDSRAIVLAAEGPDFCLGREFPASPDARRSAQSIRKALAEPVLRLYGVLRNARVPVIARVQGRAFGAGCALAACADFVIAGDSASFAVPELDMDTPPLLVMTALHGKILASHAAYLVLSRLPVSAAQALAMGLVSCVVADDRLEDTCAAIATKLSGNSALALQTVKDFALGADTAKFAPAAALAGSLISVALAERQR